MKEFLRLCLTMELHRWGGFKIIIGLAVWVFIINALSQNGIRNPSQVDHSEVFAWLDADSVSNSNAFVVFGSSNVGCSLIPSVLDSICSAQNDTWYNHAQKAMSDFELIDYLLDFVEQSHHGNLKGIYLELNANELSQYEMDWRRARFLRLKSISLISGAKIRDAKNLGDYWKGIEFFVQALFMKCTEPIHNWLYPSVLRLNRDLKGFYPPSSKYEWRPSTRAESSLIASRKISEDNCLEMFMSGSHKENLSPCQSTYPIEDFRLLQELCSVRGIELTFICFPIEETFCLVGEVEPLTSRPPVVLVQSMQNHIFSNPDFLRDPIHLNKKGAQLFTDEFGSFHLAAKK